ncbi:MAG: hypothetical protein ACRDV6_10400, partial [Acidimicrobiales bacterium]
KPAEGGEAISAEEWTHAAEERADDGTAPAAEGPPEAAEANAVAEESAPSPVAEAQPAGEPE